MKLGCSTLLFGGYDLDTALDGIRAAGYDGIELCAIPGMGLHVEPGQSDAYYADVKQKIADRGLEIESIGGSGSILTEEGQARFEALLKAAEKLGAPYITTGSGGQSDDEASFKQVVEAINKLTPACRATGVKMSIKPHVRQAVYNAATAIRLRQETDNEWVGINFDPTHVFRIGEAPHESCRKLKDHIFTLRFRDTESRDLPIGSVEGQIPGKGVMPMDEIVAAMKEVPVEYVTVEMVGSKGFELAEIQRVISETINYMKKVF